MGYNDRKLMLSEIFRLEGELRHLVNEFLRDVEESLNNVSDHNVGDYIEDRVNIQKESMERILEDLDSIEDNLELMRE